MQQQLIFINSTSSTRFPWKERFEYDALLDQLLFVSTLLLYLLCLCLFSHQTSNAPSDYYGPATCYLFHCWVLSQQCKFNGFVSCMDPTVAVGIHVPHFRHNTHCVIVQAVKAQILKSVTRPCTVGLGASVVCQVCKSVLWIQCYDVALISGHIYTLSSISGNEFSFSSGATQLEDKHHLPSHTYIQYNVWCIFTMMIL